MSINIGNNKVSALYLGATPINKLYQRFNIDIW